MHPFYVPLEVEVEFIGVRCSRDVGLSGGLFGVDDGAGYLAMNRVAEFPNECDGLEVFAIFVDVGFLFVLVVSH